MNTKTLIEKLLCEVLMVHRWGEWGPVVQWGERGEELRGYKTRYCKRCEARETVITNE